MWSLKACSAACVCLFAGLASGQVQSVQSASQSNLQGVTLDQPVFEAQPTHVMQLAGTQLEYSMLKSLHQGHYVRVNELLISEGYVDLQLERINVLAPDAQLVVGTKDGQKTLERPDVIMLSGIVAGIPDSTAYLAVSPFGTNGYVEINGDLISVSTGPYAQDKELKKALQSVRMDDVIDLANAPALCGYSAGDQLLEPSGPPVEYAPSASRGDTTCRIAAIAIETDWEFTDRLFDGNTDASAAYLVSLMGAISEIYERELNVRLSIPFLRVWGDNSDPYSVAAGDPLNLVFNEWNANMNHIQRSTVHYFTGRTDPEYGGVAYVGALCNSEYGYGVSAHMVGSFPYPLVDHSHGNWDLIVASHELGHNFGTGHTHSYSPAIDGCGNGDCSDPVGGTIMSYCHGCSGGLSNLVLDFHPRVKDTILGFLDDIGCDLIGDGVTAVPDFASTLMNESVMLDVLGNDESQSCEAFLLVGVDSASDNGGSVEVLEGQGPGGRDILRYTPADGYDGVDTFEYTISGVSGAQTTVVSIDVQALRTPDVRSSPIAGMHVDYYSVGALNNLPNFDTLTPYAEDVSMDVDYASTNGNFMNSGRSENVAAVFTGYVFAETDGVYTFSINSDDGSKLFIGDELIINNDGLHGMVRRAGTKPLSAGWHQIRIEFFERGGGAGLIATIAGPSLTETSLGDSLISHESGAEPCLADLTGDGVLDFFDVSDFLDGFGDSDPIADMDDNGIFDFFDISIFLDLFGAGCP